MCYLGDPNLHFSSGQVLQSDFGHHKTVCSIFKALIRLDSTGCVDYFEGNIWYISHQLGGLQLYNL